ncbi:hypothetical protein [Spongiactinospora gelatinilytica]|uniref:hypothetical protein n=1 Tax=Spongiactinospora gelatinilytica TaxID=2666298 RepID=UPI0011B93F19|nr:hypothetical protein [Spongiactinospora gelatinilytica]
MLTDVGGAGFGGGAVAGTQPEVGAGVAAGAVMAQAVTTTAAQMALIMAVSMAGDGFPGRERDG